MKHKNTNRSIKQQTDKSQSGGFHHWFDWKLAVIVLSIKVFILLFAAHSYQVLTNKPLVGLQASLEIWNRWDALHYMDIARLGYTNVGEKSVQIVFFPLYPWMVSVFALLLGNYLLCAFIVSGIASVAAALLLKRLVKLDYADDFAQAAVLFMFIFPTSYFLHIGYTESLFLSLTIGCFLAARTNQWVLAGTLAAFAGLTRINGLFLIPVLLVEAYQQYRTSRQWQWQWLWIGLTALGFGSYLLLNEYVTGDMFTFLAVQKQHWFKSLAFPWQGIRGTLGSIWGRTPADAQMVGLQEFFFVVLGLICTVISWRKLRPSYTIWMTCNWLLFVSTSYILSVPRYTLILFPIYISFADVARKFALANILITVWSLFLLALFISVFIQGRWAF